MCGIAGMVLGPGAPPPSAGTLSALAGALAHRGPDGAGHSLLGRTALVHTRLAIVDVGGGDQPLFAGATVEPGTLSQRAMDAALEFGTGLVRKAFDRVGKKDAKSGDRTADPT